MHCLADADQLHLGSDEFKNILQSERSIRDVRGVAASVLTYRQRVLNRMEELGLSVEAYVEKLTSDAEERNYIAGPLARIDQKIPDRATIYRWKALKHDPVKLSRRPGGTGARSSLVNWQVGLILEKLHYCWDSRPRDVFKRLEKFADYHGFVHPSYSTVRRFMRAIKARGGLADMMSQFRRGRYYEKYCLAVRHVYEYSNQIWETDGTRLKIRVWDEIRKGFVEPQLLLTIDCFSGLPMAWTAVPDDPKSADNILHLHSCLLPKAEGAFWGGRADILQSDNAKIYESGDLLAATFELGIDLRKSPPYCPSANGMIERLNQTVKGRFRDDFVGYLRKRRKLTERDLQYVGTMDSLRAHLDEWMVCYARTHRRRGDTETVLERWQAGLRKPEDAVVDKFIVDAACLVTTDCAVTRDGVNVAGQMFISPELEAVIGKASTVPVRVNVVGTPRIVIARIRGTDSRLVRNADIDGTLAAFCKDPRAGSVETLREMVHVIRRSGKRNMADHTPSTAHDMTLPRPDVTESFSKAAKIVLPSIRKTSISTNQ